jgi:hypothetical protein
MLVCEHTHSSSIQASHNSQFPTNSGKQAANNGWIVSIHEYIHKIHVHSFKQYVISCVYEKKTNSIQATERYIDKCHMRKRAQFASKQNANSQKGCLHPRCRGQRQYIVHFLQEKKGKTRILRQLERLDYLDTFYT